MKFPNQLLVALLIASVQSDEQISSKDLSEPLVTNESSDQPKSIDSQSKTDGEPLNQEASNRNVQQYNSLYNIAQPLPQPLPLSVGVTATADGREYGSAANIELGQYDKSADSGEDPRQQPITIYRPVDVTDAAYGGNIQPSNYETGYGKQSETADNGLPPKSQTDYITSVKSSGYGKTYAGPDFIQHSHTRTVMPIVYSNGERITPAEQLSPASDEQQQQQQNEYDKQTQLNYMKQQLYATLQQSAPHKLSPASDNAYSPIQAHVQVVEEPSGQQPALNYGPPLAQTQQVYGQRTQKLVTNYDQQPPKAYYPPSPPLSSLLQTSASPAYLTQENGQLLQDYSQQSQQSYGPNPAEQSFATSSLNDGTPQTGGYPVIKTKTQLVKQFSDYGQNGGYAPNQLQVQQVYSSPAEAPNAAPDNNQAVNYADKVVNSVSGYGQNGRPSLDGEQRAKPLVYKLGDDVEYGFLPLNFLTANLNGYGPEGYDRQRDQPTGSYREENIRSRPESGYGGGNTFRFPEPNNYDSNNGRGANHVRGGIGANYKNVEDVRPVLANYQPKGGRDNGDGAYRGGEQKSYSLMFDEQLANSGLLLKPTKPELKDKPVTNIGGYIRDYQYVPQSDDSNNESDSGDDKRGGEQQYGKSEADASGDKLPADCLPWNCNPWQSLLPNLPYNSVGRRPSGRPRGPLRYKGSIRGRNRGLPPGASYNPRDVGLDETVLAQLNMPAGGGYSGLSKFSSADMLIDSGSGQFPSYGPSAFAPPVNFKRVPYSASGNGYRSQYGYRAAAAASELSPIQTTASADGNANNALNNLLNPLRSLMSYLSGGVNG